MFDEQTDTGAEAAQSTLCGSSSFGEDENVEATVEGFAGVGEAALEAVAAGQREDVEERGEQEVDERAGRVKACGVFEAFGVAEVSVVFEHFAGHSDGEMAADGAGQSVGE